MLPKDRQRGGALHSLRAHHWHPTPTLGLKTVHVKQKPDNTRGRYRGSSPVREVVTEFRYYPALGCVAWQLPLTLGKFVLHHTFGRRASNCTPVTQSINEA
jgi:hypothetical protein